MKTQKIHMMIRRAFGALVLLGASGTVQAQQSPWQDHQGMIRTRLVAASGAMDDAAGRPLLAWEAELAPGWKTYWRSPGEAGLPVRLREGDASVDILYPVPERFHLFGIETYGYGHKVMLPFRARESRGAALAIDADFMVCKDICVPIEASYSLAPEDGANLDDIRINAWMQRVPDRMGDGGAGLAIAALKLAGTVGHQRLIVDVVADVPLSDADILAEIDGMVHFGAPERHLLADGRSVRFVLSAMTGNQPVDLAGKTVRLTATDGHGHAIDRQMPLGGN